MQFSDYIVYVDESGDHGLVNINPLFPAFCLAFCIFKKDDYISTIVPAFQALKFKYFGHDAVILHEHDIRKSMQGDYAILSNADTRQNFMSDINSIIRDAPFNIIASVIRKEKMSRYIQPENPYELSMLFCMERLLAWLCENGQEDKNIHILFESRGHEEDKELELEFRRICDNASSSNCYNRSDNFKRCQFTLKFLSKKVNSSGLQLADLVARPIALSAIRQTQTNRAFEVIRPKIATIRNGGKNSGKAIKIFP